MGIGIGAEAEAEAGAPGTGSLDIEKLLMSKRSFDTAALPPLSSSDEDSSLPEDDSSSEEDDDSPAPSAKFFLGEAIAVGGSPAGAKPFTIAAPFALI
mmetsp:Transcript_37679/g.76684  ORF Transcript_37679/g.76684 Transcript_37679/m.76684 type:complete len:98 (+) Transcript_37679:1956-2249(+)